MNRLQYSDMESSPVISKNLGKIKGTGNFIVPPSGTISYGKILACQAVLFALQNDVKAVSRNAESPLLQKATNSYSHVSSSQTKNPLWAKLLTKIAGMRNLKNGWDSYGALPPSTLAIENACEFIRCLSAFGYFPDIVEPTSDESILVEVKIEDDVQEWDFYSDGEIAVLVEKSDQTEEGFMVNPNPFEFEKRIQASRYASI